MKAVITTLTALILLISGNVAANDTDMLSAETIIKLVHEHNDRQNKMFSKGSTVTDADRLFDMYTADFIYSHPGQGDIYSRELLYSNSVRYIESDGYDGSFQKKVTNIITGKNAATMEWIDVAEPDIKYMTLIEFSGEKIAMMKEYW